MTIQVILDLDDTLYRRASRLARAQRRNVAESLARWLDETLPASETAFDELAGGEKSTVEREMQAYLALHPHLRERFSGEYVAIQGGKLVDHEPDYDRLYARIDAAYPDQFVWITAVEQEPIRTLV